MFDLMNAKLSKSPLFYQDLLTFDIRKLADIETMKKSQISFTRSVQHLDYLQKMRRLDIMFIRFQYLQAS